MQTQIYKRTIFILNSYRSEFAFYEFSVSKSVIVFYSILFSLYLNFGRIQQMKQKDNNSDNLTHLYNARY